LNQLHDRDQPGEPAVTGSIVDIVAREVFLVPKKADALSAPRAIGSMIDRNWWSVSAKGCRI
jgi:hypothetical protein